MSIKENLLKGKTDLDETFCQEKKSANNNQKGKLCVEQDKKAYLLGQMAGRREISQLQISLSLLCEEK